MADSHHIIDGKVVPYSGGRKCNDTDAWRDATPLELQLQEQLAEYERTTAAQEAEIEALRAEVERLTFEMERLQQQSDERTACMIVHRGSALACSDAVRAAYSEEHERAERLAEALETCLEVEERPSIIEMARVALRDHDQEGK